MNDSVESTIEKIKMQEQDTENMLRKKREHDAVLSALNRTIKDAVLQIAKSDQERVQISERIQKLRPLVEIEKIKRGAISAQLEIYTKVLEDLKAQCNRGITNVWSIRSSFCETVQNVSDGCDIRALLMRPVCTDSLPQPQLQTANDNGGNDTKLINTENRLKAALQKRKDLKLKREKLLTEPNTGEEFVRIKNALRYSLEKIANLQN